jgi:hypothetical protein
MMPASDTEMKFASLLYFKTFERELPERNYLRQDIEYIIDQLLNHPEKDVFHSDLLH